MRPAVPADTHWPVATDRHWLAQRDTIAHIASNWRWWIGDFLIAAPTNEQRAHFLNTHPGLDPIEAARARICARTFPPERRRTTLSWHMHWAVHKLPPELADHLLDGAATNNVTVQQVERAARLQTRLKGLNHE